MKQIDGSLFDKSPQAFCIVRGNKDRKKSMYEFRFAYFNEAFIKLEGVERKQLEKGSLYPIFLESEEKWIESFYEAAYNEKTSEIQNIPEGHGRYLSIVCYPIRPGYCGCILRESTDIVHLLYGSIFFAHIYVDLEKDVYSCIYLEKEMRMDIPDKGRFSELPGILIKRIVYLDDQEDFCVILKKEYICNRFRTEEHNASKSCYHMDFRSMQAGEIKSCRLTLLDGEQETEKEVKYVHMFFQNIDIDEERMVHDKIQKRKVNRLGYAAKSKKETVKTSEEESIRSELDAFMAEDFTGYRILLAEDNEVNREILAGILMNTGAEVEEAENGKAAVEYIRSSSAGYYDIVFMDISMPFMNGYEAAKAIRELEMGSRRRIPIIAMTANGFEEDVIAAKNAGMDGHIAKPIDFKEMEIILKKWLGKESIVQ